jgi:hypothetical protein
MAALTAQCRSTKQLKNLFRSVLGEREMSTRENQSIEGRRKFVNVRFVFLSIIFVAFALVLSVPRSSAQSGQPLPRKYDTPIDKAEHANKQKKCSKIPQEGESCDDPGRDGNSQSKTTSSRSTGSTDDESDSDPEPTPQRTPPRTVPSRSFPRIPQAQVCAVPGGGFCPLLTGAPQNAPCSCQVPVSVSTPYGWQIVIRLVFGWTR